MSETLLTPEEVAQRLRVPVEAVLQEIKSGRLPSYTAGDYHRIDPEDLAALKSGPARPGPSVPEKQASPTFQLYPATDFVHKWPAEGGAEEFTDVREGIAPYQGREYHVKLGFTFRNSAGKRRRRCLVIVDRYPTVEFVAADEKASGRMASIIRDRNGKQLPMGATLPPEYGGLPVGPYKDVVKGPGASNGVAVICPSDDVDTMVRHALIRYRFRQERA